MRQELNNIKNKLVQSKSIFVLAAFVFLLVQSAQAQVRSEIDTTTIRIGEQFNYKIEVETDSSSVVVFPEGQTFLPLEAVEASEIDSLLNASQIVLSRIYKLTQFDSGTYTIPRQKIVVGDNIHFTDSLKVRVNAIEVDTTKQKLYDIKPIIEVEKTSSNWWIWLLLGLLLVAIGAFLIYWIVWRKKPLTEEEEIALLPPYDRAKLAIEKLEEKQLLKVNKIKEYYSELTFIIRKYLDEKVYDRAMESTTDELMDRLNLLKDGNQFPFTKATLSNIETVLKRADLVKFAKSAPEVALAEMDKNTIAKEIDNIKSCLPEPTEEEKLLDLAYKQEQENKKRRRKIILSAVIAISLLALTYVGFGIKYGFGYVNDTILGNENKELLEGEWVESAYGFPPIWIETPEVLRRLDSAAFGGDTSKIETTLFAFGDLTSPLFIQIGTSKVKQTQAQSVDEQKALNMSTVVEGNLKRWEEEGVRNILTKTDKYTTPNGAEGLKTYGNAEFPTKKSDDFAPSEYAIYSFTTQDVIQQIVLVWRVDDDYANDIVKRVVDSIELIPDELAKEDEN
ncbi:BatD family protein [uncultured Winogradskyella sp.]|uniref:BatD family protein n=1 Tax=uncultured Winogradskyella sp. TaxID=395353 RepID=UPI0035142B16